MILRERKVNKRRKQVKEGGREGKHKEDLEFMR